VLFTPLQAMNAASRTLQLQGELQLANVATRQTKERCATDVKLAKNDCENDTLLLTAKLVNAEGRAAEVGSAKSWLTANGKWLLFTVSVLATTAAGFSCAYLDKEACFAVVGGGLATSAGLVTIIAVFER